DAARRLQGSEPDRGGRLARQPGGVPRQGPLRHGQHLPDPAAGRAEADRREGRRPALPPPGAHLASAAVPRLRLPGPDRGDRGQPDRAGVARGARRPLGRLRLLATGTVLVIDFRYHVISIVAIFLALATGIALGAGPLGEEFDQ